MHAVIKASDHIYKVCFLCKAAVVTVRRQPVAQHWWVDLMAVAIDAEVSFFFLPDHI